MITADHYNYLGYRPPVLVRLWDRDFNAIGMQFVNWQRYPGCGRFIVPADDPIAAAIRERSHRDRLSVTVEKTEERVWYIDSWNLRIERGRTGEELHVTCRPYIEYVTSCFAPDDKLVSAWLAAEEVYKKNRDPAARALALLRRIQADIDKLLADDNV